MHSGSVGDDLDEDILREVMDEIASPTLAIPLSARQHDVYLAGLVDCAGDMRADREWFADNPRRIFRLRPGQGDDLVTLAFYPVEHLLFWPTFVVPDRSRDAMVARHNSSDAELTLMLVHYFHKTENEVRAWRPQLMRLEKIMWLALAHGRLAKPPTKDALDLLTNWGWVWADAPLGAVRQS